MLCADGLFLLSKAVRTDDYLRSPAALDLHDKIAKVSHVSVHLEDRLCHMSNGKTTIEQS